MKRRMVPALVVALVFAGASGAALAWVYPEHRDIAVLAVDALDPAHRTEFDRLWADARLGHEQRLCASGADAARRTTRSVLKQAWRRRRIGEAEPLP